MAAPYTFRQHQEATTNSFDHFLTAFTRHFLRDFTSMVCGSDGGILFDFPQAAFNRRVVSIVQSVVGDHGRSTGRAFIRHVDVLKDGCMSVFQHFAFRNQVLNFRRRDVAFRRAVFERRHQSVITDLLDVTTDAIVRPHFAQIGLSGTLHDDTHSSDFTGQNTWMKYPASLVIVSMTIGNANMPGTFSIT
nr:hypothetical protein [Providencia stuartii]